MSLSSGGVRSFLDTGLTLVFKVDGRGILCYLGSSGGLKDGRVGVGAV